MSRFHILLLPILAALLMGAGKTPDPRLLDPSQLTETAPAQYTVKLKTTQGVILIDVHRAWAPQGADRFYNLVQAGFYDDATFFRVIANFVAQFGLTGHPDVNSAWKDATIPDDPPARSNAEGTVSFATAGADTRTTQLFINLKDNSRLDDMGFAPIGTVRDTKVAHKLYVGYGEGAPQGKGPDQMKAQAEGAEYLAGFPKLDRIVKATVIRRKETASLGHLDWLAGAWAGEADGVRTEERWTAARGSLQGRNLVTKGGEAVFSEELRIEARGSEIVYVAKPQGADAATEFKQTTAGANTVVFENPAHDFPQRIAYTLAGDTLTVEAAGGEKTSTWVWTRAD